MADYPDLPQIYGTQVASDDGTKVELSVSGKPRLQTYYTDTVEYIKAMHELDGPDKDSILSHYASEKLNAFAFVLKADDSSYTVRYVNKPVATPIAGVDRWLVTTDLIVVA